MGLQDAIEKTFKNVITSALCLYEKTEKARMEENRDGSSADEARGTPVRMWTI